MRFYTRQHRHDCGVDLHVKMMYLCILDDRTEKICALDTRRADRCSAALCTERFTAAVPVPG